MKLLITDGKGIAERLSSLGGWRRWLISFLIGALAAAAQPPIHLLPVLFISFPGLVWLLDGAQTRRAAFGIGWLFGAGYFAAGLYWVSNALLVDAARFVWLIPFALLGLSLGIGIFTGLMAVTVRLFWKPGVSRICILAGAWMLFEVIRGFVFTGFPWNPIGNVWSIVPSVLQAAAWIGVYGLSLVTVFAASAPAVLPDTGSRHRVPVAVSGLAVLMVFAIAGAARQENAPQDQATAPVLRIVQPNIAQREKWNPTRITANFAHQIQLSLSKNGIQPAHVLWPETAVSFTFLADPSAQSLLRRIVPANGYLLTGAMRIDREGERAVGAYNSLVTIDDNGRSQTVYDKHHLVPFGEYVPLRSTLSLDKITSGPIDFEPGPGLQTLRLPGLPPFSPLICFEAIFPGRVALNSDRPEWLLNVTNDAWFGMSAGPYQHFASAQMRAVEEGLPLVRVANTGISGVIDPYGRVISSIGLGRQGAVDVALPAPILPTFFARFGNAIPMVLAILLCLTTTISYKRNS
tara:strand:+ start:2245 stop:3801 length:1557 start_codon:yes stop_codon:yes gene_type:complete